MALRQRVKMQLEEGEETREISVVFDGRDLRAWEVKHKKNSITEPISISFLTWLGWHSAQRQGLVNGTYADYDAFDAVCIDVEGMALDDDAERPTPRPKKAATRKAASGS